MSELASRIAAEIVADGPMPFSRFMERALYEPELGFYEAAGQAGGRRGDFTTSVETGPLFAAVIGDWLDARWRNAGEPERFIVAEAAAGVGTLWRGIHKAQPACIDALEWILVERSAALRGTHDTLPGTPRSEPELPGRCDVVLANELLDNLVFDLAIRRDGVWHEQRVAVADEAFEFVVGEPLRQAPGDAPDGTVLPIAIGALDWLRRARAAADHVLAFDYTATEPELVDRGVEGWLRCYAGHERIATPLAAPGTCDITHDVPIDQLPRPTSTTAQAAWLRAHGLVERVESARTTWQERAHIGDLAAMFARSAITEAEALTDPAGLGGFTVMEWAGEPR